MKKRITLFIILLILVYALGLFMGLIITKDVTWDINENSIIRNEGDLENN